VRIDVHTHAFHPKIAQKVLDQLFEHYGITPVGEGTVEDLLERAGRAGLDAVMLHTAATDPSQVVPANNWAMELIRKHPEVIAFGSLHPGYHDNARELERLAAAGIRGLKFHPDFQGFFLDDPAFYQLMESVPQDLILMVHVGDDLPPEKNPSCPRKLAALLKAFPDRKVIAAHMGGYLHWKWALEHLVGTDVFLDTSSSLAFIPDEELFAIWKRHPRERILFGSDYPLFDPGAEMHLLQRRLRLTDSELDDLLQAGSVLFD
jgi:predicted TIM-barrel fold metal-dependent hydrolase